MQKGQPYLLLLGEHVLWLAVGGIKDQIHSAPHSLEALFFLHACVAPTEHITKSMYALLAEC